MAQVINISNPAGHNFMEFAKDRPLPSPTEIRRRLVALRNMKAVSNDLPNIDLSGNQKIAQDIVNDYVRNWVAARNGSSGFPKALRFILMGSPGAGKSYTTKAITEFLKNIIG